MFSKLFSSKPTPNILRTPSPAPSLGSTVVARASPKAKGVRSPSPVPNTQVLDLIKAVPPPALHAFLLARLSSPTLTNDELASLTTFFLCPSASGCEPPLAPPPKLHCARCHADFFECENTARSCVMAHDDDSAVVESVGHGKKETTYGCCSQSVDGDGCNGPPAGWCFEGKHCADRAAARYRHDADEDDDHLASCARKRCFQKRGHKRGRASDSSLSDTTNTGTPKAKGKRAARDEESEEDEEEQQHDKRRKRRKAA